MLDTIGTLKRVKQLSQLKTTTTTTTNSLILVLKLVTLEIDVMEEFYSGATFSKIQQNILSALFSMQTFRELYLADCFQTNLSNLPSFELARFLRPESSNTLAKEKKRRKRKSREEGRKRRKKSNCCTCLVFIMALLERFWPKNTVCRHVFKN